MTADGSEWMTIPEVATALRVDPRTVRSWIVRGFLPTERRKRPHEPGAGRIVVRRSDVLAFAELRYRGKPRPAWLDEADGG